MYALFFEVRPQPGHLKHYFEHVERLRPSLAKQVGLAYLERFTAVQDEDLLLSHQLWQDEADIVAWRKDATHRLAQTAGRKVHFQDYRIRVARRISHVLGARAQLDLPGVSGVGRFMLAAYGTAAVDVPQMHGFESVSRKGRFVSLGAAETASEARCQVAALIGQAGVDEAAAYQVTRDYGMFARDEAPPQ